MLKIIRRVLRLSGDLSKRIWGSFVCGFLESMFGPVSYTHLRPAQPVFHYQYNGRDCARHGEYSIRARRYAETSKCSMRTNEY